jgi:serine protease Do
MIRFMILAAAWSLTIASETVFAQVIPNRPIDYSDLKPSIDAVETVRLLSADKASALERDVRRAYAALAPSVVRITQPPEHPTGGGGVIVDKDGLILTCSHLRLEPKSAVSIEFFDGRRVPGTALGRFQIDSSTEKGPPVVPGPDIGLVRIAQTGEWQAARVDTSRAPKGGEICLAVGYAGTLPPHSLPLLRLGRLLTPVADWPTLRPTTSSMSGDSGGPLFELDGCLIGICAGPGRYEPLAPFFRYRDRLLAGEIVPAPRQAVRARQARVPDPGAFTAALDLQDAVLRTAPRVVHVFDGTSEVALGLIVDSDGYVITKRSLVLGSQRLKCQMRFRLGHAKVLYAAQIVAASTKHDLALLKVDAKGLPTPPWTARADPVSVGRIVASLGVDPLSFAVVGAGVATDPVGDIPQIGFNVKANPHGEPVILGLLENKVELDFFRDVVQSGDVVVRLNGMLTPTFKDYVRVSERVVYASHRPNGQIEYGRPADNSFAGDPVILTVRRGGSVLDICVPKVSSANSSALDGHLNPWSLRRHGFPAVFAHDGRLAPNQCGGPVVNLAGEVVGLNIARADDTRTLAIPAGVLKEVVDHLLAQAKTDNAN